MSIDLNYQRSTSKLSVFDPSDFKRLLLVSPEEDLFQLWSNCAQKVSSTFQVEYASGLRKASHSLETSPCEVLVISEKVGLDEAVNFVCDLHMSHPYINICWVGSHEFGTETAESMGIIAQCLPKSSRVVVEGILTQLGSRANSVPVLMGSLEALEFFDFLQMRGHGQKTTAVRFTSKGQEGLIFFAYGTIHYAATNQSQGIDALLEMSQWRKGTYKEVSADPLPEANLAGPAQEILMRIAQLSDEQEQKSFA